VSVAVGLVALWLTLSSDSEAEHLTATRNNQTQQGSPAVADNTRDANWQKNEKSKIKTNRSTEPLST